MNLYRIYSLIKIAKRGLFSTEPADDTWRTELMWRAGPARMRRGTQGHVAEPREPTRHAGDAQVHTCGMDTWQGLRKSTRTPGWRHVAGGLASEGPTG